MKNRKPVTTEMLDTAYMIIARIVARDGDKYLPIFKRLHDEKAQRKADADLKTIAILVSSGVNS